MEKSELVAELQKFTNPDALAVDLYFVFKDEQNKFVHYITAPDNDLRNEIKVAFCSEISRYTDPDNPYNLYSAYDDNEYEDFNLFYDEIDNNQVAKSIFSFSKASVNDYSSDVGSLSKVFSFLIQLSNGNDSLLIHKQNIPVHAVNSKKFINIVFGQDNNFKLINQDAVYFNKSLDLLAVKGKVIIISRSVYERNFGFMVEIENKAAKKFDDIVITKFECSDATLREAIKQLPKRTMKQLSNLTIDNPIIKKVKSGQGKKNPVWGHAKKYIKHEFKISSKGDIELINAEDLRILVKILNRDYNINEITHEKFDTSNKKLLS